MKSGKRGVTMRKDQTQIIKEFNQMHDYIHLLEQSIDEQQIEIDYLKEAINNRDQELLISRIEYDRLLLGKPALINKYAAVRGLAAEINEM
jgi:cytochrome c peroxidase